MLDYNVLINLDDILIYIKIKAWHKRVLTEVFRCIAHFSLYIEEDNCALCLK